MLSVGLPSNILTGAVSNALSGIANQASTAAQTFASNLQHMQPSTGTAFSAITSPLSSSIGQLSSDLSSGNLAGAQSDLSTLRRLLGNQHFSSLSGEQADSEGTAAGSASSSSDSTLAALQNYSMLQQNAYTNAVNLSTPSSGPGISLNF